MKYSLKITKVLNRLNLIKFFRKEINNLDLQTAVYYVDNLPYLFEDISYYGKDNLIEKIRDFALYEVIIEKEEKVVWCNQNINPPLEYIEANNWYQTLSDKEKEYVNQFVLWQSRPAAC